MIPIACYHTGPQVKATETSTLELLGSEARVVITLEDLNDHTPTFDQFRYSYSVKDNLKPGSPIHTVSRACKWVG